MTERTERQREFAQAQRQAILRAIRPQPDQRQMRQEAEKMAKAGSTDGEIAASLGVTVEIARRWLSEAVAA